MNSLKALFFICVLLSGGFSSATDEAETKEHLATPSGQSVVFFHPDGTGLAGWNISRILDNGPDGLSHWDLVPKLAIYRSHMRDHLNASSHGGGTTHAYGVKVARDSYGQDGKKEIRSASGYPGSIMMEARDAGIRIGIVNSGHLAEPGTGCMLASVDKRSDVLAIAEQLSSSGADLIFGGGEIFFLPTGTTGVHGQEGIREDGINLIEKMEESGYTVIYHPGDLAKLSGDTTKILGLFAAVDTYNDRTEEELSEAGLPFYDPDAPTIGQMTDAALKWFRSSEEPFFLMVEEEGNDNFSNKLNAPGAMEAYRRADQAIGLIRKHVAHEEDLTLLIAADSEASGPSILGSGIADASEVENPESLDPLPKVTNRGAPLDGRGGTATAPFLSAPDANGQHHRFGIAWISSDDSYGSVVARAEGPGAKHLPLNLDNTGVFHFLRRVLFIAE
ncbi:MAG: alkaline phosphatase [Verrucomicrobiota bacterium]